VADISSIISGLTGLGYQPTLDSSGQIIGLTIPGQGQVTVQSGSLVNYTTSGTVTSLQFADAQGSNYGIAVDSSSGQVTLTSPNEEFDLQQGAWSGIGYANGALAVTMAGSNAGQVSLRADSITVDGPGGTVYSSASAQGVSLGGGSGSSSGSSRSIDINPDGSAKITFGSVLWAVIPAGAQITEAADGTISVATQSTHAMILTDGHGNPLPVGVGADYVATRIRQDGTVDFLDGNSGNWLNVAAPADGELQFTTVQPQPADGSAPPTNAFLAETTPVSTVGSVTVDTTNGFSLYDYGSGSKDMAVPSGTGGMVITTIAAVSPADATSAVTSIYEGILGRAPDAAGLQAWASAVNNGMSLTTVAQAFVSSPEFTSSHPDATSAITAFYQNMLGRAPDAAGLQSWVSAANNGMSLTAIAQGFLASSEYASSPVLLNEAGNSSVDTGSWNIKFTDGSGMQVNQTGVAADLTYGGNFAVAVPAVGGAPQFITMGAGGAPQQSTITGIAPTDATADVASLYQGILGRAPDAAGLQAWASAVNNGMSLQTVAQQLIASPEFTGKNGDATSAITAFYQNILGRAPDAAGLQSWVSAANNGMSLTTIAAGFLASPEYASSPALASLVANSGVGAWEMQFADKSGVKIDNGSVTSVLASGTVNNLVSAMASMSTPGAVVGTVTPNQLDQTNVTIAASTH
jgi:hypothetical protein